MSSVKIREGVQNDILAIVSMGEKFYEESNFEEGGYDPERFKELLGFVFECDTHHVLIAELKGEPIGFIIFDVCRHYTTYLMSCMFLFYVDRDERFHNAGMALLKAAESFAKKRGAKYFYGSSSAGFDDGGRNEKALIAMYKRRKFQDNGVFMRKEL